MKLMSGVMINKTAALEQTPLANNGLAGDGLSGGFNPGLNGVLNSREARNLAEKNRRDKLNASIQELATMVPHAAEATKRLDKTAVLRFATHGLRLRYVFGKNHRRRHCKQWPNENSDVLLKLLDSFLITLTSSGQIVLVSSSVEQLLGHCQSDLYGQNILQITHPDDIATLRQQLIPNDIEALFTKQTNDDGEDDDEEDEEDDEDEDCHMEQNSNSSCFSGDSLDSAGNEKFSSNKKKHQTLLADINRRLREDKRSFTIRLARASTRSEAVKHYELIRIDGSFRLSDHTSVATSSCYPIVSQLIRRSRSGMQMENGSNSSTNLGSFAQQFIPHDAIAQAALHGISGNDIVLVGMARIVKPPSLMTRYVEANSLEYKTRHLIDGRIVECDQRISLVAGYMKEEVRNLCPFTFMHQDDVRWVIVALRQMYDCNSNFGESCYRLLSRNGHFIYLHTKGFMEVDPLTNKIHSFICINTLLSEEDGKRKVQAMKDKFSTIIKAKVPSSSSQDLPASQNPQQLEKIVLYLIENLQKRNEAPPSSVTLTELPSSPKESHQTKSLSLVPPEPESIKSSISQSVSVVNVTAAKNIVLKQQQQNQEKPLKEPAKPKVLISFNENEVPEHLLNENSSLNANSNSNSNSNSSLTSSKEIQRPSVLQMFTLTNERSASSLEKMETSPSHHETPTLAKLLSQPVKLSNQISDSLLVSCKTSPPLSNQILKRALSNKSTDSLPITQLNHSPAKRSIGSQATSSSSAYSSGGNLCSSPSFSLYSTDSPLSAFSSLPSSSPEIHHALSESFDNLDYSLNSIDQNARTLCLHGSSLVPPSLEHELDDILLENEKHKELLINIKNEYDDYLHQQHLDNLLISPTSPSLTRTSSLGSFHLNTDSL